MGAMGAPALPWLELLCRTPIEIDKLLFYAGNLYNCKGFFVRNLAAGPVCPQISDLSEQSLNAGAGVA